MYAYAVTTTMLLSLKNEMLAMLVSQINPDAVELL